MFRRWLSGFWRDHKEKIMQAAKIFGIILAVAVSAGALFSFPNIGESDEVSEVLVGTNAYNPDKTVISGLDISKEEIEEEDNIVKTFVDYCNEQKVQEAYNLLTEECKQEQYPTLKDFVNNYYNIIFKTKREYNLQAWVNAQNYNTYKVRFTENIIATGNYEQTQKFEDYITIKTNLQNGQEKKININGFIKAEEINKTTTTNELEIKVVSKDVYINYIEYKLNVKNLSNNTVLLDNLNSSNKTNLISSNAASYSLNTLNLKIIDLLINANQQKIINLKFNKPYGSDNIEQIIELKNVITDYSTYVKDTKNYQGIKNININL